MADEKSWVVTASGDLTPDELGELLEDKGFAIEQRLSAIGVFTGRASADVAAKLKRMPGIADIVPDMPVDIGPPDAPIT